MNNFNINDKEFTGTKKRIFPYFSVGMVIVGAAMLIGGGIWTATTDMSRYAKNGVTDVVDAVDGGNVEKVDIVVNTGTVYVGRSDDGQVHIEGKIPKDYVLKEKNGTLKVELRTSFGFSFDWQDLFDWKYNEIDAKIYLPDAKYESFEISGGAGEVTVDDLNCVEAHIKTGAGEVSVNNFNCDKVLKIDTGAGDVKVNNAVTGGIDFDTGTGEVDFYGEVNGDIDIDTGVGECTINLTNDKAEFEKKYKVDIDTGVGETSVNYNQ
jgi:hypothetical protein